jgi:FMN reductase [NAD(P)H]
MKNLDTRRSIRQYSKQAVSDELLSRLFAQASRTQTMGNLQLYSVVVTRSEAMKQRLAPAHFNQPMVTGAPVVLTICADFHRTSQWAECRKATPGYDNFLSFQNAAIDALLFTQTLCCLMDEEGLGYCYLGTTVYQPQQIIDILQLPQLVKRIYTPGMEKGALHLLLLQNVREEFEHNLAQQMYVAGTTWSAVMNAKEELVNQINQTFEQLKDEEDTSIIAQSLVALPNPMVDQAIAVLKHDFERLL